MFGMWDIAFHDEETNMKGVEIFKPAITQVAPGMLCRPGCLVEDVDRAGKSVLIRFQIGGTKEHTRWLPIGELHVVWSVGTYDEAVALIRKFNTTLIANN
jgi:hypothetical protein